MISFDLYLYADCFLFVYAPYVYVSPGCHTGMECGCPLAGK